MKSNPKKNQEKTTRSVADHVSAKETPRISASSVNPTGNSTQLMALSNHAANQTTNWNQTVQMVAGWQFDRVFPPEPGTDFVKIRFTNPNTIIQSVLVHVHLGTDFPSAVETTTGERLSDSTYRYDQDLDSETRSYLKTNPIPDHRPKAATVTKSAPVNEEQAKADFAAAAKKAGSGKYIPRSKPKPAPDKEEPAA